MNLPTKPGFDLQKWKAGHIAVKRNGGLAVFGREASVESDGHISIKYPFVDTDGKMYTAEGDFSKGNKTSFDLIAMLDVSALSAKTESQPTISDEELWVRFACAALTGILSVRNTYERAAKENVLSALFTAEDMLAEFKKRSGK